MSEKTKNGRQGEGGGPKTQEGKQRCAMNAIKTGQHVKRYDLINKLAGKAPICKMCSPEQKQECGKEQKCLKLRDKISDYFLSHEKRDPKYHEKHTLAKLAWMDLFIDYLIDDTASNLDATEPIFNKEGAIVGNKPVIADQRFYTLANMMATMGMTPKDLQLTRASVEGVDLQILEMLASAQPEQAEELKKNIMGKLANWDDTASEADKLRIKDQALDDLTKKTEKVEEVDALETENIPDSPFDVAVNE